MKKIGVNKQILKNILSSLKISLLTLVMLPLGAIGQHYAASEVNLQQREWFENARFGIMVHWGLYTPLAGGGDAIPSEWIIREKNIPRRDYKKLLDFFNPSDFSSEEWVRLIKESGAGYINFVVKHGDGFLLYDSKTTDFKVTNTPFGKDVLRELQGACERYDIGLIIHYYQMDLTDEDYLAARTDPQSNKVEWQRFLNKQNEQVRELVSEYGKIDGLWFNGWWGIGDKRDWNLQKTYNIVHDSQSQILISNNHHINLQDGEDYELFYKKFPTDTKTDRPRETFFSISNTAWAYNLIADDYLSTYEIISAIIIAAAHNSNFTLNIGPMPDGRIAPETVNVLKGVGEWMKTYGDIVRGSKAKDWPTTEDMVFLQKEQSVYMFIMQDIEGVLSLPEGIMPKEIKNISRFGDDDIIRYRKHSIKGILLNDQIDIKKGTVYTIRIK